VTWQVKSYQKPTIHRGYNYDNKKILRGTPERRELD